MTDDNPLLRLEYEMRDELDNIPLLGELWGIRMILESEDDKQVAAMIPTIYPTHEYAADVAGHLVDNHPELIVLLRHLWASGILDLGNTTVAWDVVWIRPVRLAMVPEDEVDST